MCSKKYLHHILLIIKNAPQSHIFVPHKYWFQKLQIEYLHVALEQLGYRFVGASLKQTRQYRLKHFQKYESTFKLHRCIHVINFVKDEQIEVLLSKLYSET